MEAKRVDVKYVRLEILKTIEALSARKQLVTVTTIAGMIDCHRNTIDNHMIYLIGQGLVTIRVGAGSKPNTYKLTLAGVEVISPHVPAA